MGLLRIDIDRFLDIFHSQPLYDFIEPHHKIFWLSFLDVGTTALMGLFNSIVYGLNASVRCTLQEKIDLWWP